MMRKKLVAMLIGLACLGLNPSHAGTAGISGVWDFTGSEFVQYNETGIPMSSNTVLTGRYNFNTGTVSFDPFGLLGINMYIDGSIDDNGDGTYTGHLQYSWNTNLWGADIYWDITDNGDNTATVLTIDQDGNGIPGIALLDGPFAGFSPVINGQLSAVPIPAAVWLFGSGLFGLIGLASRSRSRKDSNKNA